MTDANRHLLEHDGTHTIDVLENLLHENDVQADHNRAHFDEHGVLAINMMSGPGSGKTGLLERTIQALPAGLRIAVIEGDLETENDAERIRRHGVHAVQITTGMACHLDAHMVHDALHDIRLEGLDIVFIENVGNLVCPATFDIGQHYNVLLLSVTEGDDKPSKYPIMFRIADQALITKTDLLPYIDEFDVSRARANIAAIRGDLPVIEVSAKNGDGIDRWVEWLVDAVAEHRRELKAA
ncbi:hydrogenase nickel incorporation protein HypB [Propionivibrio soli]|uniref:hydrogenase nickel incorporation protein HypB n=1 Tax=Propionivibrio soli TaxID=2976531 RepID=UPI0021E973B7